MLQMAEPGNNQPGFLMMSNNYLSIQFLFISLCLVHHNNVSAEQCRLHGVAFDSQAHRACRVWTPQSRRRDKFVGTCLAEIVDRRTLFLPGGSNHMQKRNWHQALFDCYTEFVFGPGIDHL